MIRHLIIGASALILVSCTTAQRDTLADACSTAMRVADLVAFIPVAAPIIPYVRVGCGTAEGLAKLTADPSSIEWVGQLTGKMKAVVGRE